MTAGGCATRGDTERGKGREHVGIQVEETGNIRFTRCDACLQCARPDSPTSSIAVLGIKLLASFTMSVLYSPRCQVKSVLSRLKKIRDGRSGETEVKSGIYAELEILKSGPRSIIGDNTFCAIFGRMYAGSVNYIRYTSARQ